MTIGAAWRELVRRCPLLARLALVHLATLAVLLLLMIIDDRQLLNVDPWMKPARFAASIAVYLATMAWLLGELEKPRWLITAVAWGIAAAMLLEQVLITMQAARGVPSHYNDSTAFDSAVFSLMGFGVAANSAAVAVALLMFLLANGVKDPCYLWGIRLGLLLFLLGSVEGFVMIGHGGHTVGAADGGPGMPLTGWSTIAGDLRVAHFLGIHALQFLPAAGWTIDRLIRHRGVGLALLVGTAIAYAGLCLLAFMLAWQGRPWPIAI
jgi:hypothetical protein